MNRQTHVVDPEGIVRYQEPQWVESYADVNITYGGLWVKDHGDYAEVFELTDLDSAAGASSRVLISTGSISYPSHRLRGGYHQGQVTSPLRTALRSCGPDLPDYLTYDYATKRIQAWHSLWDYGFGDRSDERILAIDEHTCCGGDAGADFSDCSNGFTSIDASVDGEDGLRAYLRESYELPV